MEVMLTERSFEGEFPAYIPPELVQRRTGCSTSGQDNRLIWIIQIENRADGEALESWVQVLLVMGKVDPQLVPIEFNSNHCFSIGMNSVVSSSTAMVKYR